MPLPNNFGSVATGAQEPGSALDANFAALGVLVTLPCTATGTNAINLTPFVNTPTVSAYQNFLRFSFTAAAATTGAVTLQFAALAALPFYFPDGVTQISSGALTLGQYVEAAYSNLVNSGGGGFVWINPASGAAGASYVLLATVTASNVASVAFTSGITSTYDNYDLRCSSVVPVNNAVTLGIQISENAGGTWLTTPYQWSANATSVGATNLPSGATGASAVILATVDNTANEGYSGTITVANPSSTTSYKPFRALSTWVSSGSFLSGYSGGWFSGDLGAINGIRFIFATGNISSGFFALYGVRRQ